MDGPHRGIGRGPGPSWLPTSSAHASIQTSPQSNLRRARRSSADKTNSKLLQSHSPSMLTPLAVREDGCRQQIWRRLL